MVNQVANDNRFVGKHFTDGYDKYLYTEDKKTGFLYLNKKPKYLKKIISDLIIITPFVALVRMVASAVKTIFHFLKAIVRLVTFNKNFTQSLVEIGKAFTNIFHSII